MKNIYPKHILIIRFRQIGDAVLSTVICNTLKLNFPEAKIDMVLNLKIAPLFENHPSIDRIITFTEEERHSFFTYLRKVHGIMRRTHYDVIIDMRSNINTLLFTMFSLSTPFRIGIRKSYSKFILNYTMERNPEDDILQDDLRLLKPLETIKPLQYVRQFTLSVGTDEREKFKEYMKEQGINFDKPVMLVGVTAKLSHKIWDEDKMVKVLELLLKNYPDLQLIFNYAQGKEREDAEKIYKKLNCDKRIFINIQARSLRELAALSQLISVYFGNEGGTRHIAHAMGKPSLVICSPGANKHYWLPQNGIPAIGIGASDILTPEQMKELTYQQKYDAISVEMVWKELHNLLEQAI